jgi:hypothetical protein
MQWIRNSGLRQRLKPVNRRRDAVLAVNGFAAHNLPVATDHFAVRQSEFLRQHQDYLNLRALAQRGVGENKQAAEADVPGGGGKGVPARPDGRRSSRFMALVLSLCAGHAPRLFEHN